jgi:hypothetical protein
MHGGRAWVEYRPGGGASFRVFLPDIPVARAERAERAEQAEVGEPATG